jgi:hypothetical protein
MSANLQSQLEQSASGLIGIGVIMAGLKEQGFSLANESLAEMAKHAMRGSIESACALAKDRANPLGKDSGMERVVEIEIGRVAFMARDQMVEQ